MDDYGIKGNQSATFASIIYIRDSRYTDITSFRQNIDAFFTYQLETPQLVGTISPIQLKTLVGQNNIWSNANGDVDVKYWKH